MQTKKTPRDNKGDMVFDFGQYDWKKYNNWRFTWVFHYYDIATNRYRPCFDIETYDDNTLERATRDPGFYLLELFPSPDKPPFDFHIQYSNLLLHLRIKYFKEVLEEKSFSQGYMPSHNYWTIILPKVKYYQIINLINDYNLLPIRDLIFEVIATAQKIFTKDVAFWLEKKNKDVITTAKKESQKVIGLLEKVDDRKWLRDPNAPEPKELQHISFVFHDETVRIEHKWLVQEFLDRFKEHYNELHYKNWRKELKFYPNRVRDLQLKLEFKYRLAISFRNLFVEEGFFKIPRGRKTTNELMLCIAKLLEHCLIDIGNSGNEPDDVKIKIVRNWITRKKLNEDVTYLEVNPNKRQLSRYFGKDLMSFGKSMKRLDVLETAYYLAERFDLKYMLAELAHIADCIQESNMLRGSQLLEPSISRYTPFKEKTSFISLLNSVQSKRKIKKLKIEFENIKEEVELTHRLPLYIVEQAIETYIADNKDEIDNDVIKATFFKKRNGSIAHQKHAEFRLPEERFCVWFTDAFYRYLLKYSPPKDNEAFPSERYFNIIACMLHETWHFSNKLKDESEILRKVKHWHKLANEHKNDGSD